MANNPAQLRRLLESLSQELFDQIYDLTFTATPGVRQIFHKRYLEDKTPKLITLSTSKTRHLQFCGYDSRSLLLVDRASSMKFAESHFGGKGAVFVVFPSSLGLLPVLAAGFIVHAFYFQTDLTTGHEEGA